MLHLCEGLQPRPQWKLHNCFLSDPVWFVKDQILRDFTLIRIHESTLLFLLQLLIHAEIGCEEKRSCHEFSDMLCEERVCDTFNEAFAHNHMITEIFHNRQREIIIIVVHFWHHPRAETKLFLENFTFNAGTNQRKRPRFANDLRIRKGLFDNDTFIGVLIRDMENQIQITVSDLTAFQICICRKWTR